MWLHRVVLAATCLVCTATAATSSCSPFTADAGTADGGPAAVAVARDFTIAIDWPTNVDLDPRTDKRGGKMRVTVTDAADSSRTQVIDPPSVQDGPFTISKLVTTNLVDVVVELRGFDDRLLGYGERRRWAVDANSVVPVAVRKRLLYVTSDDRNDGELRVLDMAPLALAEPGIVELQGTALESLHGPVSIAVTSSGLRVVQGGTKRLADGGAGDGALEVLETSSHTAKTIALPFWPERVAVLDDDRTVLVAPSADTGGPQATTFARVDLDTAAVTQIATGVQGGSLATNALATSPDRKLVAVVATQHATMDTPFLIVYDVAKGSVLLVNLALEDARGVGFTTDGKSIVVAGHVNAGDWGSGMLLFLDASAPGQPTRTISLLATKTKPNGLFIHPDGVHAWVTNETKYPMPTCCDEMRLVDLVQGVEVLSTPQSAFEIASAVRLPYAPNRVIAGQTDNGNDVNGSFVDITNGGALPTKITFQPEGSLGSANLVTPFGHRL